MLSACFATAPSQAAAVSSGCEQASSLLMRRRKLTACATLNMLKIINVVGARPNFMKVAPLVEAMKRQSAQFAPLVVHTGQHYDSLMSDLFFRDLDLPTPDVHLGVGSASHAAQTAAVMERFEPVVIRENPDWVMVVGDVNSTLACALVCIKLGVRVAHV